MRYIFIFGITTILSLFLIFYPKKEYLGIYKEKFYIEYDYKIDAHNWVYTINNDNLSIKNINENKWEFIPKKNGISILCFYYTDSTKDKYKYKITYKFKIKDNKIYWLEGQGYGLLDFPNPY